MVFQSFNLFPHLSAQDNIIVLLLKVHKILKNEAIQKSGVLLEKFDLSERKHKKPAQLSGGQRQRVAIARALLAWPYERQEDTMDVISKSKFKIILSMVIWGSIGAFVREISLSSLEIAFYRALIGSVFLGSISLITKVKIDRDTLKKNLFFLSLSGIALGFNWVLLFQAMKYTTISNAVLSYYFAPVFIVIFSAILFKENISAKNMVYLLVSILGLFIIMQSDGVVVMDGYNHLKGITYGLGGAVIYAVVVMLNKYIKGLSGIHTTLVQLLIATIALIPFIIGNDSSQILALNTRTWIFIITLGILHTGIAYFLYFSSMKNLKGKSIAILSYLDPIVAIAFSFIFLGESMNKFQIIGGILILSASYISETNRKISPEKI